MSFDERQRPKKSVLKRFVPQKLRTVVQIQAVGLMLALLMVGLVESVSEKSLSNLNQVMKEMAEAEEATDHLQQLLTVQEFSRIGYLLTLDKHYFDRYQSSGAQIPGAIERLAFHVDAERLQLLNERVWDRQAEFERTDYLVEATLDGWFVTDVLSMSLTDGRLEAINQVLSEIHQSRWNQIDALETEHHRLSSLQTASKVVLYFLVVLLSVMPLVFVTRRVLEPIERLGSWMEGVSEQNFLSQGFPKLSGSVEMNNLTARVIQKSTALVDREIKLEGYSRSLREKNEQQEELFAIIGHELRTPASTLKLLFDDQNLEKLEPHGRDMVNTLEHLLDVLDDMRAVTQPDFALGSPPRPVNLLSSLERCVQVVSRIAQEHNVQIELVTSVKFNHRLVLNEQIFKQVCMNLMKNAAYHSGGSKLVVTLTTFRMRDDKVEVDIDFQDNGSGIDQASLDELFVAFRRGQTDKDGTGLGLYLSRKLAEDHLGGELNYVPSSQPGALFRLTISALEAVEEPAVKPSGSIEDTAAGNWLEGKRVLLAEDSPMLKLMTEKLLTGAGATVTAVDNGELALQLPDIFEFDLVLTDIFMPVVDGYRLTAELRARGYTGPIIGVTAASIGNEIDKLKEQGASAALTKPLRLSELNELLTLLNETQVG